MSRVKELQQNVSVPLKIVFRTDIYLPTKVNLLKSLVRKGAQSRWFEEDARNEKKSPEERHRWLRVAAVHAKEVGKTARAERLSTEAEQVLHDAYKFAQ